MKRYIVIKEQPWWSIIAEEWKRAKKLRPSIANRPKPKFMWDRKLNGRVHGECGGSWISFSDRYLKHGMSNEHFIGILRHELAHIGTKHGHGESFKRALALLEGPRYASAVFEEPKKK